MPRLRILERRIWEQWQELFTPEKVRECSSFFCRRLQRVVDNGKLKVAATTVDCAHLWSRQEQHSSSRGDVISVYYGRTETTV